MLMISATSHNHHHITEYLYGPLCHLGPYFCILLRCVCVADTKTDCRNSSLSTPLARLGKGPESSHHPQGDALEASLEELRMQDDVCLLQVGLLGWVKGMVLVEVVVVELVMAVVEVVEVEVVRKREETRCVPVIVRC